MGALFRNDLLLLKIDLGALGLVQCCHGSIFNCDLSTSNVSSSLAVNAGGTIPMP